MPYHSALAEFYNRRDYNDSLAFLSFLTLVMGVVLVPG